MNEGSDRDHSGADQPEASSTSSPQSPEGLRNRIQEVLDEEINPGIAMHGGFVVLLDIGEQGQVFVQMGGGCQGCGMADVTLKQGIETILRERIPEMGDLIDTTDHASGTNPYFMPSK